jgi:protein required for attachment to host cells
MYRTCIAIVDASRARLFTLDRTAAPGVPVREEMVEQTDLVNPARRLTPSQLFSDSPGGGHGGNFSYGLDDHRSGHIDALDAEFAREIDVEIQRLIGDPLARRLIVCASPRMLGELRKVAGSFERDGLTVEEVPRDLVKLTPPQIREHLSSYGLLPS